MNLIVWRSFSFSSFAAFAFWLFVSVNTTILLSGPIAVNTRQHDYPGIFPMGRKRSKVLAERTARIHQRVRPSFLAWLKSIALAAGDDSIIALIYRLAEQEAKRLRLPPPPPR